MEQNKSKKSSLLAAINLRLRARIRKWKAERKLRKSKYITWANYKHNRDNDICSYAEYIDDFYKGYPYLYACPNPNHYAYHLLYDYGPGGHRSGYHDMSDWCSERIRWNYRVDIHRVWQDQYGRYNLNDIGGSDIIFFAFKREKDFSHFLLRWA